MSHERKDRGVVLKTIRKSGVNSFLKMSGGKVSTVKESEIQLDIFTGKAEKKRSKQKTVKAFTNKINERNPILGGKLPKTVNIFGKNQTVDMETVCRLLPKALEKVASNKGAAGPDNQSIEDVKTYWSKIYPSVCSELLEGQYQPGKILRRWIPKAVGGKRGLGIPNTIDRVIQEAIREVIEPVYESCFHANSHGFRPYRGCQTAISQAKEYIKAGHHVVVDIDLKDFFNRVNHQRLLSILYKEIKDKRMLHLISRMLKAKVVMPDGVVIKTEMGVPQGGPLSPLLSNIVLNELDKELSRRGHKFVRYADDCNIYVKTEKAGERVMRSIKTFIEKRLRLEINMEKSKVAFPRDRHFLGFRLDLKDDGNVEVLLSERSIKRMKMKVKELTPRNRGSSMKPIINKINSYIEGWLSYFRICTPGVERFLKGTDAHIRRRLRAIKLKQWKRKRTIMRKLIKLGGKKQTICKYVYGKRHNLWFLSHTPPVDKTMNNRYWVDQGLRSLTVLWEIHQLKINESTHEQMEFCFG